MKQKTTHTNNNPLFEDSGYPLQQLSFTEAVIWFIIIAALLCVFDPVAL